MSKESNVVVVYGTVAFYYDDEGGTKCLCCPNGKHAHSQTVELDDWGSDAPEHFHRNAQLFLTDFAAKHEHVGKRVRITVEIIDND